MNSTIKDQLLDAVQRLRKPILLSYYAGLDLTTLSLMKAIEDNSPNSDHNIYMFDLQNELRISRGAISQIASNLEKKGYLVRETDKNNRRKQIVTLTPEGREAMRQSDAEFDEMLTAFLTQLGEHDAHEMVRLFNRFADIAQEMNQKEAGSYNTPESK
ncbi:MAG TPA: MarR family winged helix-turn-helix transcriptional regulator [Aggregatilineales bacterium]|nr:winged helix-turn-helix transcriptional regulator [Anaerolineae bacterium]HUN09024.1 MarR family winged helix-turn-helix transcriptional regulator [Aggregatilineales bacterium]